MKVNCPKKIKQEDTNRTQKAAKAEAKKNECEESKTAKPKEPKKNCPSLSQWTRDSERNSPTITSAGGLRKRKNVGGQGRQNQPYGSGAR